MTFEEFVARLRKPLFVWTMAWADQRKNTDRETRMNNARKEIDDLIDEYHAFRETS